MRDTTKPRVLARVVDALARDLLALATVCEFETKIARAVHKLYSRSTIAPLDSIPEERIRAALVQARNEFVRAKQKEFLRKHPADSPDGIREGFKAYKTRFDRVVRDLQRGGTFVGPRGGRPAKHSPDAVRSVVSLFEKFVLRSRSILQPTASAGSSPQGSAENKRRAAVMIGAVADSLSEDLGVEISAARRVRMSSMLHGSSRTPRGAAILFASVILGMSERQVQRLHRPTTKPGKRT